MRPHEKDLPTAPGWVASAETGPLVLAAVEAVADAIVTADEEGRVTGWTGGAVQTFGWTASEIVGEPLTTLIPERFQGAHREGFARVVAGGEPRLIGQGAIEVEARRKDGTEFPAELTVVSGVHDGHRFFGAVIRDIGRRHRAEAERRDALEHLARVNEELERFASLASHDLQEPLRIVDGYLRLLSRHAGADLDPTAREFIGHASSAVARMQQLIDDLLRYARAGAAVPAHEEVDLGALAEEVLEMLGRTVEETAGVVTVDPLPRVIGDEGLLRQVLQNLIGNALKYARPGFPPRVHVSGAEVDGGWEVAVTDEGLGVPPDRADSIFAMFDRGTGAARDRAGSGIGLAIVERAVAAHGGEIRAETNPAGAGSVFRFTIPRPEETP